MEINIKTEIDIEDVVNCLKYNDVYEFEEDLERYLQDIDIDPANLDIKDYNELARQTIDKFIERLEIMKEERY